MHESIFAELSLIIALGAAMALFMRSIRQPLIIGHILTGIIVGPSVLHLVKSAATIDTFASIGIALLLFIIGLGLNPKVVREVGKVATLVGLVQVGVVTVISSLFGYVLGMSKTDSLFFGLALAFSSTIVILKLLSDKKEQTRLYGKVTTGVLLIQDIIAVLALMFVSSKSSNGFTSAHLSLVLLKGLVLAVPLLLIGNFVLPRFHRLLAGSQETLFLFALGWGFGSAALFEQAGFSLEIGALLAGVSLASLPYTQEIASRLRPLRDFFIVVFFITLGTRLSFGNFALLLPLVLIGSFIVVVIKPLVVLAIMSYMGYTDRTSFNAAVATAQVSEFSLVLLILGSKLSVTSNNLVAVITFIALVTIAISSYLIIYSNQLFDLLEPRLKFFDRSKFKADQDESHHHDLVLLGYKKGGHEFLHVFESLEKKFVVVDYDPDVIDNLEHQKLPFIYGDVTDAELLDELGVEHAKLIVSVITDFAITVFLAKHIMEKNPHAVLICHAETVPEADELYALGVSYVMMPHYIGSEKIGALIKKSGFKRSEFKKYREKHQAYLHSHYQIEGEE